MTGFDDFTDPKEASLVEFTKRTNQAIEVLNTRVAVLENKVAVLEQQARKDDD